MVEYRTGRYPEMRKFLVMSGDSVLQAAAVASATQQQLQLQTAQAHINNVAAAAQQTQVESRAARPTDQAKFEFKNPKMT